MNNGFSIKFLAIGFAVVTTFVALSFIKPILWPFVLAIVISYVLSPWVKRLENLGLSRSLSAISITILFFSFVIIFLVSLFPLLITQLSSIITKIPNAIINIHERLISYGYEIQSLDELSAVAISALKNIDTSALKAIGGNLGLVVLKVSDFANEAFLFITVIIMMYYLLKDWDKITDILMRIIPPRGRAYASAIATAVGLSVSNFFKGQLIVMIILGTWYVVVLSLVGLNYSVTIGTLTGLLVFIPYVGAFIGFLLATLIGILQFDSFLPLGIIWLAFIFAQTVESMILSPIIVGDKVGLHAVWMIFALMVGAALFGFIGVLLAVPVTASIGAAVRVVFLRYQDSEFYGKK